MYNRRPRKLYPKICEICKKEYVGYKIQKYCSPKCQTTAKTMRQRKTNAKRMQTKNVGNWVAVECSPSDPDPTKVDMGDGIFWKWIKKGDEN